MRVVSPALYKHVCVDTVIPIDYQKKVDMVTVDATLPLRRKSHDIIGNVSRPGEVVVQVTMETARKARHGYLGL
jgi:hypothetical protein